MPYENDSKASEKLRPQENKILTEIVAITDQLSESHTDGKQQERKQFDAEIETVEDMEGTDKAERDE